MKDYNTKARQQRIKDYQGFTDEKMIAILETREIPNTLKVIVWID